MLFALLDNFALKEVSAFSNLSCFKSYTIPSVKIWIGCVDLVGELFKVVNLLQSSLAKTDWN